MNEAALEQVDALIRHGATMPLAQYITLREAEKNGFSIRVVEHGLLGKFQINVTLATNSIGWRPHVRRLKAHEARFAQSLKFEARSFSPYWNSAPKNSSNTVWFLTLSPTLDRAGLRKTIHEIEQKHQREIRERERLEEEEERRRDMAEAAKEKCI